MTIQRRIIKRPTPPFSILNLLNLAIIVVVVSGKKDENKNPVLAVDLPPPTPSPITTPSPTAGSSFLFETSALDIITSSYPPTLSNSPSWSNTFATDDDEAAPTPSPLATFGTFALDIIPSYPPTSSNAPSTSDLRTPRPTTFNPTSAQPTSAQPTSAQPTSAQPTTSRPTTAWPTPSPSTLWPTPYPTPFPNTPAPFSPAPTTLQSFTPYPTTPAPASSQPTPAPTTLHPIWSLLQSGDVNCYDISKEECKESGNNCEWTRDDESGELYCEFITMPTAGSGGLSTSSSFPTPADSFSLLGGTIITGIASSSNCNALSKDKAKCVASTNCEWVLDDNDNTFCQSKKTSSSSEEVSNCYVLSLSQDDCQSTTNCEWVLDTQGDTLCRGIDQSVPNCYVLSLSEQNCIAASNCEWAFDGQGKTLCRPSSAGGGGSTPSSAIGGGAITPFPTPTTDDDTFISNIGGGGQDTDCLDPNLSKQACKDALNCVWDKQQSTCLVVTTSPTPFPTPSRWLPPPLLTLELNTPAPTIFGYVNCDNPNLIRKDCLVASNCIWDGSVQNGRCVFGTWPPSPSPTTERPSDDPTSFPTTRQPTDVPTDLVTPSPTTDRPTTGQPSPSPSSLPPTPWPIAFDILDVTDDTFSKQEIIDCTDPNISKNECKESMGCVWNKFTSECNAITAAPTTPLPTGSPSSSPTISSSPTASPTFIASYNPSSSPTGSPSSSPTSSHAPTASPSMEPTASSKPTISSSPTDYPTITSFPTMAAYDYVRPKRNDLRFVPWNKLERSLQLSAQNNLRYTKETWNNLGTNSIEQLRWDDLSNKQKVAAIELGFEDEVSWNCWMNHWESFSWKQLYTLELTPYLTALGWDMHMWNREYNDPPMKRKGVWSELTMEQRHNATQLCYYKTSYDRLDIVSYGLGYPMAKPDKRFVPWEDIEEMFRVKLEQSLGYTELTWNVLRLADVEQKGWFEFVYDEKDTATELGFDDASWDCWQNHYDSYGWYDLVTKGHDVHYIGLGWSEMAWDGVIDPPPSEGKAWNELTETEQLHATELCMSQDRWDKVDMTRNDGPFPLPKPKLRYSVWETLSDDDKQIAANVLLYEETTWNDVGRADIEKRAWDDLTEYQKPYAIQLGLYHRTWDCFQNHYRATKWNDLPDDVLRGAISLGWDENSWNKFLGDPESYKKRWNQLRGEEKSAAYALCHFNVTWPGDGSSINLVNQYDSDLISENAANQLVASRSQPAVLAIIVTSVLCIVI